MQFKDSGFKNVRFEIEKEVWNKYELSDSALLRVRVIMVKMLRKPNEKDSTKMDYNGEATTLVDIEPLEEFNLYGEPSNRVYLPQEIISSNSIDVNYKTITEDWNNYRLEDGTKIKTKQVLVSVKRLLDKYDLHGIPVYNINSTTIINVELGGQ